MAAIIAVYFMKKNYYLNVCSQGEHDTQTKYDSQNGMAINIGLVLNDWPEDDLFQSYSEFFVTNRLASKLVYWQLTGFELEEIRVNIEPGFTTRYEGFKPDKYFHFKITGQPEKDDFFLWNRSYLIVSEKALVFLRNNHVIYAKADEIQVPLHDYFNSEKMYFWMEDGASKRHLVQDQVHKK